MGKFGRDFLKEYWEKDVKDRFALLKKLNPGGSLTPEIYDGVMDLARNGSLDLREDVLAKTVELLPSGTWKVAMTDGSVAEYDRIWLATGMKVDFAHEPMLEDVLKAYPIDVFNGIPELDENLKWKGCNIYVMGRYWEKRGCCHGNGWW